jgi:hypothetical protein
MHRTHSTIQKFGTPAPVTAILDVPAGYLRFIAADRVDTTVEVLPANPSKRRDVEAAGLTDVTYRDGVLRIKAPTAKNQLLGPSGAVEVTVQLPAGSRVRARTASAELRGVGRLDDVTFDGAQGAVKLDETAGARLTLHAGSILIGRLTGDGNISTHKGDLTITEAVRGTLTLRTEAGDIRIGAARGTAATLDAGTAYGRIHNTLSHSDDSTVGLSVHATTAYGDITALSL